MVIWKLAAMAAASVMLATSAAHATAPITVTYTVTGAPGAYTYDFSFTNNDTGTAGIYALGVGGLDSNVAGTPGGWSQDLFYPTWTNAPFGGSATIYTNNWCFGAYTVCSASGISSGQTVSGFMVLDTGASIQSMLPWYAFAYNGVDTNDDGHFYSNTNPGFEGQAFLVTDAVPEPATWALMLLGFGAVGTALRRRRRTTVVMQQA
jgi:hypothetical protein